jgi:hypothetical protein
MRLVGARLIQPRRFHRRLGLGFGGALIVETIHPATPPGPLTLMTRRNWNRGARHTYGGTV